MSTPIKVCPLAIVALFRRAWIEINIQSLFNGELSVALFRRAWIEIVEFVSTTETLIVALFRRAWIEIIAPQ